MTEPRTVLVTGGTKRLGRAISERLRADGWRVLTSSHRSDAGADIVADLSEGMGAARLYAAAMSLCGGRPPDALVNNAAIYRGEAERVRSIGFVAPQKLTMLMAGRETGRGFVVNVLDAEAVERHVHGNQVGEDVSPRACAQDAGPYLAAKRDLAVWTLRAAALFVETLNVNAVAPGPVLSPEGLHEKALETPLGRPTSADVADAVSFLLGARATSGCLVPVDGGRVLLNGAAESYRVF